jgi:hypothetical protein
MPSVVRIRIEGLRGEKLAELLGAILGRYGQELAEGVALTVQISGIRFRRLPLRGCLRSLF